jgi:BirA family transcriptional regulator, biotin operon repressor / biotin---[acetyl-CoA-carboxylase] ligase
MSEPLPPEIAAALRATADRRYPFGEPAYFFSETQSTNDVAAGLAERGAPEGAMVVASSQTAGRGRFGRDWFSPPGAGLYVSVVVRDPRAVPLLTLAGGVAVADGITAATGLPLSLKWPNDVVAESGVAPGGKPRKLAGVLAEASSGLDGVQHVILGFGINLRPAAYPPDIADRATSIESELGRVADAGSVLAETLSVLARYADRLRAGDVTSLLARWRALAPSSRGSAVQWDTADGDVTGVTAGIDDSGALLVRAGGRMERIVSGALRWI